MHDTLCTAVVCQNTRMIRGHAAKQQLLIVVCGHVDAGKGMLTDRLRFELGGINEREIDKMREAAAALGKSSFSFYVDRQKSERERGVTIASTTKEFFTETKHFMFIDAPEHKWFIRNAITGASQPDVALLLVPADEIFVTSIAKGDLKAGEVQGQTRKHAMLMRLVGVKQLIVGVNKMDCGVAKYGKERYDEICSEVSSMLIKVGWKKEFIKDSVPMLPISGWIGDNLVEPSANMAWWTGVDIQAPERPHGVKVHVHTLLDALEKMVCLPVPYSEAAMRLNITGVYRIKGTGDVLTGRVEQGTVKPGTVVVFIPTHTKAMECTGKLLDIEMHHKSVTEAGPRCSIGVHVMGLYKGNMPRVGDVMVLKSDHFEAARLVEARVHQFLEFQAGDILDCFIGCFRMSVEVVKIAKQGKNVALVTLEALQRGLPCETVDACPRMARVGLAQNGSWVGLGNVEVVERWGVRFQRAAQAAMFVMMAFRSLLSRDVARIIAKMIVASGAERAWSVLM